MRLSQEMAGTIVEVTREVFGPGTDVYLFGSRTDDEARGGDIDLLVECSCGREEAFRRRLRLLVELEKHLGERRVDVVVKTPDSPDREIYHVAEREGIQL